MEHINRRLLSLLSLLSLLLLPALVASLFTGCGGGEKPAEKSAAGFTVIDSLGREVHLNAPARRAIVENAYNAELITAIGAIEQVAGVDYYIYQDQEGFNHRFTENMLIGKGKGEVNYERIIELNPDVFITTSNSAWTTTEEKLKPFGIPVLIVDAYYTDQFAKNVALLGKIFGREREAQEFGDYFTSKLAYIEERLKDVPKKTVYFEYRTAGTTTIPGDYFYYMVNYAHADNIFADAKNVHINPETVPLKNPSYIIKVSDTDVFSSYVPPTAKDMQKIYEGIISRPGWDDTDAVKNGNILLLSHYVHGGASKLVGTMYIAKFLYPEELPDLEPEEVFKTWVEKYQQLPYIAGHTRPAFPLPATAKSP